MAARRKDLVSGASTGVDLPRPRSLRVPKGGKREGSGRGRHRRRGRLGLCCSLSWVQPSHCEV